LDKKQGRRVGGRNATPLVSRKSWGKIFEVSKGHGHAALETRDVKEKIKGTITKR